MSRDSGFSRADVDTSYMDDDKVRRLWRMVEPDVARMCECVVLHQSTLLSSWREGRRMTVEEAAPLWFPGVPPALVDPLVKVGLLDAGRRIPVKAFKCWIGPAVDRRAKRSEAGRKGGLESAASRSGQPLNGRSSKRSPLLNPTGHPSIQPSNARGDAAPRAAASPARITELDFKDAMAANGVKPEIAGRAS